MKSADNRLTYLVEGLRTLQHVALRSGIFLQPEPSWFPDYNQWEPVFTANEIEIYNWLVKKHEQHRHAARENARHEKPRTGIDTYWDLMYPLFSALKISRVEALADIRNFDERVIPNFLKLEAKHPRIFTVTAANSRGGYRVLIHRFNGEVALARKKPLNPENVPAILRRGLALYRESVGTRTNFTKLLWGLALLGCGALAINNTQKCAFCPRRSLPSKRYCAEHSQADTSTLGRTKSKQASNYRAGKRACEIAASLGLVKGSKTQTCGYQIGPVRPLAGKEIEDIAHAMQIAEILIPNYRTWDGHLHWEIRRALKNSPLVQEMLGGINIFDSSYIELVESIREKLDLYERDEDFIPTAVSVFERWLECEAKAKPSVRGPGTLASRRMRKAIALAKRGKNRTEISTALRVGQSTVTLWTKKSDELTLLLIR